MLSCGLSTSPKNRYRFVKWTHTALWTTRSTGQIESGLDQSRSSIIAMKYHQFMELPTEIKSQVIRKVSPILWCLFYNHFLLPSAVQCHMFASVGHASFWMNSAKRTRRPLVFTVIRRMPTWKWLIVLPGQLGSMQWQALLNFVWQGKTFLLSGILCLDLLLLKLK